VGLSTEVAIAWQILEWAIALFLLIMVFALTYYWAPDVAQAKWLWITPGSILGILTWIAASLGFRLYLHYFDSYSKTYGSMGAVIVLLLWFYVSGFELLFGAEINGAVESHKAKEGDPSAKEKGEKVPG
jgi:membrane protein